MLFLRDIQVDIQMRCRDCGHEGVLARRDLERRFGPNYPVLSIAPHYRCSRCHSREVESRPVQEAASFAAAPEQHGFDNALGALQGLLQAVRGESRNDDGVQDLMGDDLLDTMVEEEPEAADSPFERAMAALRGVADDEPDELDEPPREDDDRRTAEVDAFDELMAKLTPARSYEDEKEADAPEPPPQAPKAAAPADSPLDETLAALRALTFAPDAEEEDQEDEFREDDLRDEFRDAEDDAPEDLDDIPDEEIVSFAIRDPDARGEPEPEPEPDADLDTDDEPFPIPFRRPPPQPGSLDESLAALRALVEKAAADEPEPKRSKDTAPDEDPDEDRELDEPEDEEPEDDRPPLKTAQEKSLEETLAQLRGMLDLDNAADDEGEPVVKPRRR